MMDCSGWLELRNRSREPIELVSQHRKKGRKIAHVELKPGTTQFFLYSGLWCVCIIQGDVSKLQVTGFGTGTGKGHNGNRLLMK